MRHLSDGRAGLGRGSINVSAVRETDAGLYRCHVTFPNRTPPARNNGTFYRLEVDGESLTPHPPPYPLYPPPTHYPQHHPSLTYSSTQEVISS